MSGIDWGDAPTWLAGGFAAAAAWYTRGMLRSQRQQIDEQRQFIIEQSTNLSLERAELRAQADTRRRAQARVVGMSASFTVDDESGVMPDHWVVKVTNDSAEPIHGVTVRFGEAYSATEACEIRRSDGRRLRPVGVPIGAIGPGRTFRFISARNAAYVSARPRVNFVDGAGVQWELDEHGRLSEVPVGFDEVSGQA
ncbi:hypothetical protein AB4225_06165 [Streptomyces sp. 2RAF24]|uniref:hypothetical protein n=1 Tax=Streptomyces sp. 2RAF24 TaxID=3232997 RepID=UPI003F9B3E8D